LPLVSGSRMRTNFLSTTSRACGRKNHSPWRVCGVLASIACIAADALTGLGGLDLGWLQGFFCLANGPHGGVLRNGSNKPVAFVMTAEEPMLFVRVADEEQQVTI